MKTIFFTTGLAMFWFCGFTQQTLPVVPKTNPQLGDTYLDSKADYPQPIKARKGNPNILIIMLDDVGFGASSTFGGPVNTPTCDWLARNGLLYNQFHTTALCSPSRAALLTGRNHHSAGTGVITEFGTGFPGYTGIIPKETALTAEILRDNGYSTAAFGKWHNTPDNEISVIGPFDHWPTYMGFEYFYGFQGGETNQWFPSIYENTVPVITSSSPAQAYNFMTDMTDKAVNFMEQQKAAAPDKPFYLYFAPGATHAPHQPLPEYRDKYKGEFNMGWDKLREITFEHQKQLHIIPNDALLTPRPMEIPSWEEQSTEAKKLYEKFMENYAGYLEYADAPTGRLIDELKKLNQLNNTLVIYIMGDNGASLEGSLYGTCNEFKGLNGYPENIENNLKWLNKIGTPETAPNYPVAWAWAMNTPFQWGKQIASHLGGIRNGMVISWPNRIKDTGQIRSQFHHLIDIAPTILDATQIPAPTVINGVTQKPIEGVSMLYTFDKPDAPSEHHIQYFEMFMCRGLYKDGWFACTRHNRVPWMHSSSTAQNFNKDEWELYNLDEDYSQAITLAAKDSVKLKELKNLFWEEALKYNVLPLDDRTGERGNTTFRPNLNAGRKTFIYYNTSTRIPEGIAANIKMKSYEIRADIIIPQKDAEGVIITQGGNSAGWSLIVKNGKAIFIYNWFGENVYMIASSGKLPTGDVTIRFQFIWDGGKPDAGGSGILYINSKKEAEGRIEKTVSRRFSLETLDVGIDYGTSVCNEIYNAPFPYNGTIKTVTIDLK
ncbi:MAG: arylsulfatase [Chitinophagales bacterium]|nr:arylsulfatase [Chitinophagales bacterium]